MKIVTGTAMQALDRRTITEAHVPSAVLMERAGEGIIRHLEEHCGSARGKTITIFCGKGNNGGDGLVAARLLCRRRARVQVVLLATVTDLSHDATAMYRRFVRIAGRSAVHRLRSSDQTRSLLASSDILVDALLGTGLSSEVTGTYREAIELINGAGKPVIAIDIPSGIHADTGDVLGRAIRATLTITFGLPKLGLYAGAGIDHAGTIRIVDIGIPPAYVDAILHRVAGYAQEGPVGHARHHQSCGGQPNRREKVTLHAGNTGFRYRSSRSDDRRAVGGIYHFRVPSHQGAVTREGHSQTSDVKERQMS